MLDVSMLQCWMLSLHWCCNVSALITKHCNINFLIFRLELFSKLFSTNSRLCVAAWERREKKTLNNKRCFKTPSEDFHFHFNDNARETRRLRQTAIIHFMLFAHSDNMNLIKQFIMTTKWKSFVVKGPRGSVNDPFRNRHQTGETATNVNIWIVSNSKLIF